MRSIPFWLDAATFRQDYFWFLIVTGWLVVLAFWWKSRPLGLMALALAVVANATAEVVSMLVLTVSTPEAAVNVEALLGLMACLSPVALFASAAVARWGGARGVTAVVLACLALVALALNGPAHRLAFVAAENLVAAALGGWGAWHLHRRAEGEAGASLWFWTGIVAAIAPAVGSSGVVAELFLWPRRWLSVSPIGVIAATVQLVILLMAFLVCRTRAREQRRAGLNRSLRIGFGLLACWLMLGGFLVEIAGRGAYTELVRSLRARARTCLSTLDTEALATCLGPEFRLVKVIEVPMAVWKALSGVAPATMQPDFLPHQRRLEQLRRDNLDFAWIQIQTLRQGWLVDAILPFTDARRNGEVSVTRGADERDLARWSERAGYVDGPAWTPRGTFLTVAEPVLAPNGRMLGWFSIDVESSLVLKAQMPARLLMCLTVAMGAGLGGGFMLLRMRNQEQREAQAEAAAALAADRMKSALLAHVSHELRTPLQGILGYAELLAERKLDDQQRSWLLAQRRHGELLLRLVNDLLDLGALENGVFTLLPRPGQLAVIMEETVASLRPKAQMKRLQLELELDPVVPAWLSFDADRVRQIVLNLVGNALKFTERGGVLVAVRRLESRIGPEWVGIEIAIADSGPGISREDRVRLFKPFSRLPSTQQQEGAGLGLALTRGLCLAMKGSVEVESDGRTGATFRAIVNLSMAEPPAAERDPAGAAPSLKHFRVVVADDNVLVRELYMAHLSAHGASCVAAEDGRMAIAAATAEPKPDVLLLDLAMPHMDGMAVARHLRRELVANIRIVGVSAHGNPEYRRRALEAGMDEFLVKPVSLGALVRCVSGQATGGAPISHDGLSGGLNTRMSQLFRAQAPGLLKDLDDALVRGDWTALEVRAHYLKNSAWVLRQEKLAELCDAVCEGARRQEGATVLKQLVAVREIVDRMA